jgi:tetratricopeptide (TPR) repeat protein
MLVLLEQVGTERQRALGAALLAGTVGDTAAALAGLDRAAGQVTAPAGKAAIRAFAGDLALARADTAAAEALLLDALAADSAGPSAPAAEYLLASVYADAGRNGEALERLEHLILAFPASAVLPQARRLLDRVRGAVPKT